MMRRLNKAETAGAGLAALAAVIAGGLAVAHETGSGDAKPKPVASATPTPTPENSSPAVGLDNGTRETVRHGEVANQALIVKAYGRAIELHAGPNINSKVVGTVPEGQSIVLERNLGQLNTQQPGKHFWIGGTTNNAKPGEFEWLDTSKLAGNAITNFYPPADAPSTVRYKEEFGVLTATNVEGPVAEVFGPMSEEQAMRQIKADGFEAPSVD